MSRDKIWIALLLASVLLNGVLLGAGARDWLAPDPVTRTLPGERGAPARRGFDLRAFSQALPPEARAEARERFDAARPELRALTRRWIEARRAAMRALAAEDFEPQTAAAALSEARRARAELEAATEAVILDTADGLDAQTRREALRAALGPARAPQRGGAG